MSWEPIATVPLDGTSVWIAVRKYFPGAIGFKPPRNSILCRYDSWNRQWRQIPDGKVISSPEYGPPDFWCLCEIPVPPDFMEDMEALKA